MENISGYGIKGTLIASRIYPAGITLTQFADDADPFDLQSLQVSDTAMGLNGDLITWSKANPLKLTLNLIPGSEDDKLLGILLEANRVGRGKDSTRDVIVLTFTYPDGTFVTFTSGVITDGVPGRGVASSGRLKTRAYSFAFENKVGTAV